MPGYVIFFVDEILDAVRLEEYKRAARPTIGDSGGSVIVAHGRTETVEGETVVGTVVVKFPTYENAQTWYHSEAYAKAKHIREGAVKVRSVIVESLTL